MITFPAEPSRPVTSMGPMVNRRNRLHESPPPVLTVTLNFALDVTYRTQGFEVGEIARVECVGRRAGGKGVNVARILSQLGRATMVTGLAGGHIGHIARSELRCAGLREELVEIAGESRMTVAVVDCDHSATGFWEEGPVVGAEDWSKARTRICELIRSSAALVLAGSLPPGVPRDAYAQLIEAAREAGVPALLDAEGEALTRGIAAAPTIVKINRSELFGVTSQRHIEAGADELRAAGAEAVVVTDGGRGITCITGEGVFRSEPLEVVRGNPTGAGDAVAAALIAGVLDDLPWSMQLAHASALAAAAVRAALAGSYDADTYQRLKATRTRRS